MPRPHRFLAPALVAAALAPASLRGQDAPNIHVQVVVDTLAVRIQYPPEGARLTASDSTFVFGAVTGPGAAEARVTVNGVAAEVDPGGGWIAFVPVSPDTTIFVVRASAGGLEARTERTVAVPRPLFAPGPDTLPYKPETIEPEGPLELYAGDTLRVAVVAAPDLEVRARIGEDVVPLVAETARDVNRGRQVWGDEAPLEGATPAVLAEAAAAAAGREPVPGDAWVRWSGDLYLRFSGALRDTVWLEMERAGEPLRVVPVTMVDYLDPTRVPVVVLDDDTAGTGRTDHRVIARTGPGLGYQLFLPNGTVAATLRRRAGWREIALGPGTTAWVDLREAFPVPGARPGSEIAVVRTRAAGEWSEVVIPTGERLPFRTRQAVDPVRYTIDVYGLVSNVDFMETAADEPLIESLQWSQPANGVFRLEVDLRGKRAWGYRARWEGTHLVLGFRRPPEALADKRYRSRLHGVRIVVDPGHSPEPSAIGPTGYEEKEANLAIALVLAGILEQRGAEVVLTRATPDSGLGLYDRTNLAVASGGELFVSIHNNALPDGVNPFVHNGTSILFYHPQSSSLAKAIQAELLPRTGLPDNGVWHQNIAVGRMTEMPSVLVECAFMMLPEQEAALKTPEFRREIARGIAAGIERWLEESGDG